MLRHVQTISGRRSTISVLLSKGMKKKEIAEEAIGVANSTITRELHRNSSKHGVYKWEISQKQAEKRRKRTQGNRAIRKAVWFSVKHYLVEEQWSPEQISGDLAKKGIKISHETIYAWIRENKRNYGNLYTYLRHRLKHRNRYVGAVNPIFRIEGVFMTDLSRLTERDSEMDAIVGLNNQQAIVILVDEVPICCFMKKLKYGKDANKLAQTVVAMLSL